MAPETKQVRAAVQATIYALLDYLDPGGFGGGSYVQCQQAGETICSLGNLRHAAGRATK
jgi:hypothetical protein